MEGTFFSWRWSPSRGKSDGILVGTRNETFQIIEQHINTYFVRLLLLNKGDGLQWNLVIVYGATQMEDNQAFLTELAEVCHHNNKLA